VIELVPVRWPWDAITMARIRNTCREYMTNDTSYIGPLRQLRWWWSIRHDPSIQPFLFRIGGRAIGFGLIRKVDSRHFVTGGIRPESRGHGLGRYLFGALCDLVAQPVFLEVLEANQRAQRLYHSLGFKNVATVRLGVLLMRRG